MFSKSSLRRKFGYAVLSVLVMNQSSLTLAAIFGVGAFTTFTPNIVFAQEVKQNLLEDLKKKYDLDNPYKNYQDNKLSKAIENRQPRQSKDLTNDIVKSLGRTSNQIDLSKYTDNKTPNENFARGKVLSQRITSNIAAPSVDEETGSMSLEYSTNGTRSFVKDEDGNLLIKVNESEGKVTQIDKEDLHSNEINRDDYDFNADTMHGDDEGIINEGKATYTSLKDGNNASSNAFQAITAGANRGMNARVSPNADWLRPSNNLVNDLNNNTGLWEQTCTTNTQRKTDRFISKSYDEFNCQDNTTDNLFFCEVERSYRVPVIIEGGGNWKSCGEGCFELTIGDNTRNNFLTDKGSCGFYEFNQFATFNLQDGIELESVNFVEGYVDDHIEFTVDDKLAFSMTEGRLSFSRGISSSTYQRCEFGNNRGADGRGRWYYAGDKTAAFKQHLEAGTQKDYKLGWNALVGGKGEYYARIQFKFSEPTGEGFGEIFKQYPEGCLDKVKPQGNNQSGNQCSSGRAAQCVIGEYREFGLRGPGCYDREGNFTPAVETCNSNNAGGAYAPASSTQGGFCRFDGWTPLDVSTRNYSDNILDRMSPMYEGDTGRVTWKASMDNYRCDPLQGEEYCVISDETGEEECFTWEDLREIPDQCKVYEDDDTCQEVNRVCTEGWSDDDIDRWSREDPNFDGDNYCFNETVTYRCEEDNSVDYEFETTTNTCDSLLPCVGSECTIKENESNGRFLEASVQANILQNGRSDRTCENEGDPTTCRIFEGQYEYCSWEVTGLGMDCCEKPGGVNILAYVSASQQLIKLNSMSADGLFGSTAQETSRSLISATEGGWNAIKEGVTSSDTFTTINNALSSSYDSLVGNASGEIIGATGETVTATTAGISNGVLALKNEVFTFIADALPDGLSSLLFEEAGQQAVEEGAARVGDTVLTESASSFFTTLSAIYTTYQLVKLALTLLTACDDNEQDMGVKLAQRACFKVGKSYCVKKTLGLSAICIQKRQDYCCYNSILARIIMEQAYGQLGIDKLADKPKAGDGISCRGLTQSEMGLLDFDRIDLSEWVGLMLDSGEFKTSADEQSLTGGAKLNEVGCDSAAGRDGVSTSDGCYSTPKDGRSLNAYGRTTASERNKERLDGAADYAEDAKDATRRYANSIDCSASPRPPVCDFGFNISNDGN